MKERNVLNPDNLVRAMELPEDVLLGEAVLALTGSRRLVIQNHRGIVSFDEAHVVVRAKKQQIVVDGKALLVVYFARDMLTIEGRIDSIAFRS
jgi:sporulation protein YqfC